MRILIVIALMISIFSCRNADRCDIRDHLSSELFIGEWQLDSSSAGYPHNDRLIILPDSTLYLFLRESVISKGRIINDSLLLNWDERRSIVLLDSNRILVSGGFNNMEDFFKRTTYGDYRENLKEYLQQDSLRSKIIGWWKLIPSEMPVRLNNSGESCKTFTLNISGDGKAVFLS
jgi:hypothetical protein